MSIVLPRSGTRPASLPHSTLSRATVTSDPRARMSWRSLDCFSTAVCSSYNLRPHRGVPEHSWPVQDPEAHLSASPCSSRLPVRNSVGALKSAAENRGKVWEPLASICRHGKAYTRKCTIRVRRGAVQWLSTSHIRSKNSLATTW